MKKLFAVLFIICICLGSFCSCGKDKNEPTSERSEQESTLPPSYTTVVDGKTLTAQKFSSDDKNYQVGTYDEDGRGTRFEYYKDGKLSYYYISSDFDETGNSAVQKYYNADGELLGSVDENGFHDADGKTISESEMDALLPS